MSYENVSLLNRDVDFSGRVRSCCTEQGNTFVSDSDPAVAALAQDVLRGGGVALDTFVRITASSPGLGDKVAKPDGTIDQSQITDGDILAAVQPAFATISKLFYDTKGVRVA